MRVTTFLSAAPIAGEAYFAQTSKGRVLREGDKAVLDFFTSQGPDPRCGAGPCGRTGPAADLRAKAQRAAVLRLA